MILGRNGTESGTRGSLATDLRLQTALNSTQPPTMLSAWLCLYEHMRTHTRTCSIKWVAPVFEVEQRLPCRMAGLCFVVFFYDAAEKILSNHI